MLVVLLDDCLEEKEEADDEQEVEDDKEVEDREVEGDDVVRDRCREVGCQDHRVVIRVIFVRLLDVKLHGLIDKIQVSIIDTPLAIRIRRQVTFDVFVRLVFELVVRVLGQDQFVIVHSWVDCGVDASSYTLVTRCFFSNRSIRSLSRWIEM